MIVNRGLPGESCYLYFQFNYGVFSKASGCIILRKGESKRVEIGRRVGGLNSMKVMRHQTSLPF